MLMSNAPTSNPAVVARTNQTSEAETHLLVMPAGRAIRIEDPEAATAFPSMREAIRMTARLPTNQRAYGLPREAKVAVHRTH